LTLSDSPSTAAVARLSTISVRDVWKHEAHDFTPWILSNADRLGEALGINLELTEAEHSVGKFSLDLIGLDLDTGARVIIENQLEPTDHNHLGQILTYAGGTSPSVIVWVATEFREEHRSALNWLNENTGEEIGFYAVKVSAVRIDDSRPAALFDVVVRPNNWEKRVRKVSSTTTSGPISERYIRFWDQFYAAVATRQPGWSSLMKRAQNSSSWVTYSSGVTGAWFGVSFAGSYGERSLCTGAKALRSELYFGSPDGALNDARYQALVDRREELESHFGGPLSFEPLPERKSSRVAFYVEGATDQEDRWQEFADLFIDSQLRLRKAVEAMGGLQSIFNET